MNVSIRQVLLSICLLPAVSSATAEVPTAIPAIKVANTVNFFIEKFLLIINIAAMIRIVSIQFHQDEKYYND